MEGAQRRRLSIIASHIHPVNPVTVTNSSSSGVVSSSKCSDDSEKECSNLSSSESDCVFCKIVKGDSPALKLYEDDSCVCFGTNNPREPLGTALLFHEATFPSLVATPAIQLAAHPLKSDPGSLASVDNI
ncbi:histidine triad nucleotide-binding 3 [Artemisia annua]|uniref:Histidine triad nucleotide-binding 3 n=1 Tax=Artemisia annua TaxID=35608 RepID=A0A2U1PBE6_ARTAN|nr:histidine triad nucleotide-binding 3 [Artemisia annua]